MIKINNLRKQFGKQEVLKGINLGFNRGKCYGIVGANGAGKTTLFNCILGLESSSGEIYSELKPLKNHTGFLPTSSHYFPRITGREYLDLFCQARGIKSTDFDAQNIFDLPLDRYAEDYSTGMKKKLSLMAILFQKNDVFILDEPFNGVDIQSNLVIVEIIGRLKNEGKTILIASHIFQTLADTCDEIFYLKEGLIDSNYLPETFNELESTMKNEIIGDKVTLLQV